ncbi:TPA: 3'-5' exonuclease [Campylobacter jejuni]|nr:3'-5' exonuclease [Campylobacter jejuni]HEB7722017.1 3'-5' exonuclease [Campylobacter jejuni]HEB7731918.1 3'-5' exonuclease [Campylobacter jejuni]
MENYDIDIYGNPIKVKKPSREFKGQSLIYFPKSYVVIDLETTGFDPKCNEILEIVALRYENNEKIAEFSKLIKVSFLPSFITEFTGINEDMIKNCNDISQTLKEFDDFLKSGDILVAHNAHFDINFLYDNFICYLNKPFSFDFVDTMRLSKLINQELAHHRLKDLCNQYNICYENAHRGEKDCELTHLCLMELKKTAFDNSLIENDVLVNNGLKTQIRQTQTKAKDIQAKIQEEEYKKGYFEKIDKIIQILIKEQYPYYSKRIKLLIAFSKQCKKIYSEITKKHNNEDKLKIFKYNIKEYPHIFHFVNIDKFNQYEIKSIKDAFYNDKYFLKNFIDFFRLVPKKNPIPKGDHNLNRYTDTDSKEYEKIFKKNNLFLAFIEYINENKYKKQIFIKDRRVNNDKSNILSKLFYL